MNQTKEIYNMIADEFDLYRVKVWNCVKIFLENFNNNHLILDIGCGNGKNIIGNSHLNFKGIDFSEKLVEKCKNKNLDVICNDMTSILYNDNMFDGFISVASYHHLDNDMDRKLALNEMYRILKPGGIGMIVVWAMEQGKKTKLKFNNNDTIVEWKSNTGRTYHRYYHIYREGELKEEITRLEPGFIITHCGYDRGNWYIHLQKPFAKTICKNHLQKSFT